ncbi:MAG: glycosyltransferase family 4 protein, partial [Anaerolineae bacterium]
TVHDVIPLLFREYRGGAWGELYLRLVMASARRATRVLTDSRASAEDIVVHLRVPRERVRAIPLAADLRCRPVRDAATLASVRGRYRLPERFALYLGGFDRRKNVLGLLRAFARWVALEGAGEDGPWLVVAGRLPPRETPLFPDPVRLAGDLGLGEKVLFPGWVDDGDKPALYTLAEFFVFPSWYEGFGLPVLEAMACGTPVIASRRASLPEIVGDAGLLVDPEDEGELASAMAHLWHSAEARQAWAERALERASRFRWEEAAVQTLACLREAAALSSSPQARGQGGGLDRRPLLALFLPRCGEGRGSRRRRRG